MNLESVADMKKNPLNFNWTFKPSFEKSDLNGFDGIKVDLPHTNQLVPKNYFSEEIYQFTSIYEKLFEMDQLIQKRYFILFEGVMTKATVYLNGKFVGEHVGGYTHFKFEITDAIHSGLNRLSVIVDSRESKDHPPFGHVVDYLTYGGIYREVTLIETELDTFDYVHVDGDAKTLNIGLYPNAKTNTNHQIRMIIHANGQVLHTFESKAKLDHVLHYTYEHALKLWSLDCPKMYTLDVLIDDQLAFETEFGLRSIHVDENHFYLNGEKIFLRGLNRHQSYPYVGYAMPKRAQKMDADILKYELGVNIVRSSHYPPSKHFLNRCDEIGLLVFTELPGWQHIGDEVWKKHALDDLESLVMNDYNHPSIVIIGTRINESKDDHDFYTKTRNLVKSIDRTRPTGGVRFFGHSEFLEDIYTINDFIHRGDNRGVSTKKTMTKKIHPYLITEFNGHMFPTKAFDSEQHRIEHTKRHFKVLNDAYREKGIMGAIGWCMSDYNTHKDFGSNDHICYHGVLDMNRNPKYASSAYASQKGEPYMEVLSMMHIGERAHSELKEVIVSTNLDAVRVYKNDLLIGTYTRKVTSYPDLPYPPIVIKDFIGRQIHDHECFSEKDATIIKNILLKTLENGLKMSLSTKLKMGYILLKYKMKYEDAVRLYTTYIGGWGDRAKVYRFEGLKDNQVMVTRLKGYEDHYGLKVSVDTNDLVIDKTYDVARVTVELVNGFGERAYYTSEVIEVETSDHIEMIGPHKIALQGGIQSFWVKTKTTGKADITITSEHFLTQHLTLTIAQSK